MKSLSQEYDQLLDTLEESKAAVAHVSRAKLFEHQRVIDAAGVAVIAFEVEHGIDEARLLREHEKGFAGHLEQFEGMATLYAEPVDWAGQVAAGSISSGEVEEKMAERALVLSEAKKSVVTLKRLHADADKRRQKFSKEVLSLASRRDALTSYERQIFTEQFLGDRPNRITREVLDTVSKPELVTV